jgi:hypothetical protein
VAADRLVPGLILKPLNDAELGSSILFPGVEIKPLSAVSFVSRALMCVDVPLTINWVLALMRCVCS